MNCMWSVQFFSTLSVPATPQWDTLDAEIKASLCREPSAVKGVSFNLLCAVSFLPWLSLYTGRLYGLLKKKIVKKKEKSTAHK